MTLDPQPTAFSTAVLPFTATLPRGQWPADISVLPFLLTEPDLAHLMDLELKTLQKKRRCNQLDIPWIKDGRRFLYPRADVLKRYGARTT